MVEHSRGEPVLIKKYANRRLYDTQQSRYITLDDLARKIHDGAVVKVVDANRGTDLTRQVLTQVILEEQDRLDLIPVEMLHHVIKVQGTVLQGPFASFLTMAMKQFHDTGSLWQQQMDSMFDGWSRWAKPAAAERAADPAPEPETERPEGETDEDLGDLRQRMDDLLDRLGKRRS